jgi:hypothetical protein
VFEHLPDPYGVAQVLRKHLSSRGFVIINLPVSDGLVFRFARTLARIGVRAPLERMWQVGMPSPHLSYFSGITLSR